MATNPNYSTAAAGQYPLADPATLDPQSGDEEVLAQQQYDTEGVFGQTGPIPDPSSQYPASNVETTRDGSGGAFGEPSDEILTAAQSGTGQATPPLVPAVQLETDGWGYNAQADGLLVNPTADGGGGGNDYLVTGNQPGSVPSYTAPTYLGGAGMTGYVDTESGGGSPIQQANPPYRAPEAYPAALVLDTTRTDQPVSASNSDPYGINSAMNVAQNIDWTYPTYPLLTTSTNDPTTPSAAPVATAINRGASVEIQAEADPAGAEIHGYRVEAVHLKTGYSTVAGTSWTGDAIAAAGVTFFNKIPTRQTFLSNTAGAPAGTPTTGTGAAAAGNYYAMVVAVNAAGTTLPGAESAEVTLSATGEIAWTWTAVAGATGYRLYVGSTPGGESSYFTSATNSFTQIATAGTAGTPPTTSTAVTASFVTATVDDLIPGDHYAFRYMAVNDNGTSAPSAWSNIIVPLLYDEVPTGSLDPANAINPIYLPDGTVKANTGGTTGPVSPDTGSFIAEPVTGQPTQLNVTFTAPTWGTPTGYTINVYRLSVDNPYAGVGTIASQDLVKTQTAGASPSFPINITGLVSGTQYVVEVIPFTAGGKGLATYSEVVTAGGAVEPEPLTNEVTVQ